MDEVDGVVRVAPGSKRVFLPGFGACLLAVAGLADAAPLNYQIDPAHTFPSFEADHMGISVWRGKFNTTSGSLVVDRQARTGTVEVRIDIASVDFGLESMNEQATSADFFDAVRYPQAIYRGHLLDFVDGAPTRVAGELTLRGVTRPLELRIGLFKCIPHPMFKREVCGADASATFRRDEYGLVAGKDYGFDMGVQLRIQMEAVQGGLQP